jgi:hypothetical protein
MDWSRPQPASGSRAETPPPPHPPPTPHVLVGAPWERGPAPWRTSSRTSRTPRTPRRGCPAAPHAPPRARRSSARRRWSRPGRGPRCWGPPPACDPGPSPRIRVITVIRVILRPEGPAGRRVEPPPSSPSESSPPSEAFFVRRDWDRRRVPAAAGGGRLTRIRAVPSRTRAHDPDLVSPSALRLTAWLPPPPPPLSPSGPCLPAGLACIVW